MELCHTFIRRSDTMTGSIDGFKLKLIAIIAMALNHIGSGFSLGDYSPPIYFFTEFIGKLTFPIMAYLLVEGFYYTKNRTKYAGRLAIFCLVSAYPFHLLFHPNHPFSAIELVNNIFFTLLMGLLLLMTCEKVKSTSVQVALAFLFSFTTILSDWTLIGVLMIFGFYKLRGRKIGIILPVIYGAVFLFVIMALMHVSAPAVVPLYEVFTGLGILLVIPILLAYNGERGYSPTWVKWGFYGFYPLHLLLLVGIRFLIQ
ncbi:hypothetical protein JZO67_000445 [Enterococcus sp. 665A]|uniref:Fimbrial assembly protein fimC n=2 Tax=Candidatus Enterococcus ferrettii TaxID=2815324 RepID=A0ABV0EM75_9ENTE